MNRRSPFRPGCAYCGRSWRTGLWRGWRPINHTECWRAMGYGTTLLSETGVIYTRADPVPADAPGVKAPQ